MKKKRNQISIHLDNDRKKQTVKQEPIPFVPQQSAGQQSAPPQIPSIETDAIPHSSVHQYLWNEERRNENTTEQPLSRPGLPFSRYGRRKNKKQTVKNDKWKGKNKERLAFLPKGIKANVSFQVLITALIAIAVGVLLGIMVLSIFSNLGEEPAFTSGEEQWQMGGQPNGNMGLSSEPMDERNEQMDSSTSGEDPLFVPSGMVQDGVLQLPSRSYYVVQAGAFSESEAAEIIFEEHRENGWAGLLFEQESPYHLYIGLASTKDEAQQLGHYYENEGLDIYIKDHPLPEVDQVRVDMDEEALSLLPGFLSTADQILSTMSSITAEGISGASPSISDEEWSEIEEYHRSMIEDGQRLFTHWPEDDREHGERMIQHMTSVMNALGEYRQQEHPHYLWQVQQGLLEYVHSQEQFLTGLS